jgi:hypothetical protein
VLKNDGNGSFGPHSEIELGNSVPLDIEAAEVTGDNHIDLVVSVSCTQEFPDCLWHSDEVIDIVPNLGDTRKAPYALNYHNGSRTTNRNPNLVWTNYWQGEEQQAQISKGALVYSSPAGLDVPEWTTPYLSDGFWVWKARTKIDGVWSAYCEPQTFEVYTYHHTDPSCPILYASDGQNYVRENPLLTASAQAGYQASVTDYYHLTTNVVPQNGQVEFLLQEVEDEITSIEHLELITIDHSPETRVATTVDGKVVLYQNTVAPISAVDNRGQDILNLVTSSDNLKYESEESGYIIVSFENPGGGDQTMFTVDDDDCQINHEILQKENVGDSVSVVAATELEVEILGQEGSWLPLATVPPRENHVSNWIMHREGLSSTDTIQLRISWNGPYSTDFISHLIPVEEEPVVAKWPLTRFTSSDNPSAGTWENSVGAAPLTLKKGQNVEFSFRCDPAQPGETIRDYMLVAIGRYEPDYNATKKLLPDDIKLYANYPNPFNPTTTIAYDLPKGADVTLELFNINGQKVRTLINSFQTAGRHSVLWDGTNSSGQQVASGMYFYRLTSGKITQTRKMLLLK